MHVTPHRAQTKPLAREIYTFPPQAEFAQGSIPIGSLPGVENCATAVEKSVAANTTTYMQDPYGLTMAAPRVWISLESLINGP